MSGKAFYRVNVEQAGVEQALVLHVYGDGVERETIRFELTPCGAHGLLDEVRWLEWMAGAESPSTGRQAAKTAR